MQVNDILTLNYEGLRILNEKKLPDKTNKLLHFISIFNARVVEIKDEQLIVELITGFILEPSFKDKQFKIPKTIVEPLKIRTNLLGEKTYLRKKYY